MNPKMAAFVGIGFEVVGLIWAGVWIGGWLDKTYALQGMGTAAAVIVALVGWFLHLLAMLKRFEKDDQ